MTSWLTRAKSKSSTIGECIIFTGGVNRKGYAQIWDTDKIKSLHRLSYKHYKGEIPEGLIVRHTCDNPSCWNPDHLELGTHTDNMKDMINRNRSPKGSKNANSKLLEDDVLSILKLIKTNTQQKDIANIFGISIATVSDIKKKKQWSHLTIDTP